LEEVRDVRRYQEALAARERRMDQALDAIRTEHDEIRAALGVLRQTNQGLTRRLEQVAVAGAGPASGNGRELTSAPAATHERGEAPFGAAASADALTDAYVGFEDQFRGS